MSLNTELDIEIKNDLRKYLFEDAKFLSEDEEEPKNIEASQVNQDTVNKATFNKIDIKKKAVIVNKKARTLIDKMKNSVDNEEELLKAPSRLQLLTKTVCKFGVCATLLGGPIGGIMGVVTSKFLSDGVKTKKRIDYMNTLKADLKVIEMKIEELNSLKKLSNEQKNQRYELLKLKETTEQNINKLRALIVTNDER